MTDKITITRKMAINAIGPYVSNVGARGAIWDALVLDSQKKEPIERWAVEHANGDVSGLYIDKRMAEERVTGIPSRRVVHLREVEGDV